MFQVAEGRLINYQCENFFCSCKRLFGHWPLIFTKKRCILERNRIPAQRDGCLFEVTGGEHDLFSTHMWLGWVCVCRAGGVGGGTDLQLLGPSSTADKAEEEHLRLTTHAEGAFSDSTLEGKELRGITPNTPRSINV